MANLSWEEFVKVDIRVGTIIEVNDFPKARNPSFRLLIDFGDLGIRKSSAQITKFYDQDTLLGTQILAVVNFPPKQIANFVSECLVLGIYDENKDVVLVHPERKIENGCRLG